MRIITDELFAKLIAELMKDTKVAIFQELVTAQKADPVENDAGQIKVSEDKK